MPEDEDKDKVIADLQRDLGSMRKRATDAEAKSARLEADTSKEFERGKAEGAASATATLRTEHAREMATAEVRAAAARVLADPDDAPRFLDMAKVLDATGAIDRAAIDAQLGELVEKKPYLRAAAEPPTPGGTPPPGGTGPPPPPPTPRGDGDGGPRGAPGRGDTDSRMNDVIRNVLAR
jgi:hypothetical protein